MFLLICGYFVFFEFVGFVFGVGFGVVRFVCCFVGWCLGLVFMVVFVNSDVYPFAFAFIDTITCCLSCRF